MPDLLFSEEKKSHSNYGQTKFSLLDPSKMKCQIKRGKKKIKNQKNWNSGLHLSQVIPLVPGLFGYFREGQISKVAVVFLQHFWEFLVPKAFP